MTRPWESMWQITKKLATGGQGVTKKVVQKDDPDKIGVLKYLKDNKSLQARARMTREVNNLSLLPSLGGLVPNVLDYNTYEFENISSELFVVMDFIEGPTLAEYVETHGPLSIDDSIKIVMSICQTVAVAHEADILHRDIKPDNLILKDGSFDDVFIIDYGLSFNLDNEDITQTDETFRNKFLDLPETNTPTGNHRDPRSDLTALCAILYFCLTGHKVGHLQDSNGTPAHLRKGFAVREAHPDDNRIENINEFLSRGFSIPLESRFQSIDEFEKSLVLLKKYRQNDVFQLAKTKSISMLEQYPSLKYAVHKEDIRNLFQHINSEFLAYQHKLELFNVDFQYIRPQIIVNFNDRKPIEKTEHYHKVEIEILNKYNIRQYFLDYDESVWALYVGEASLDNTEPESIIEFDSLKLIAKYKEKSATIFPLVSTNIKEWITQSIHDLS